MKFEETPIPGAFLIEIEPNTDHRGFFARVFCQEEFRRHGLELPLQQFSISFNHKRGTLRGMHYQADPKPETKLVRCTAGAIFDVIVDLRDNSPTFKKWFGVELSAENRRMLYIPKGIAHGFLTVKDNSEVFYMISEVFVPEYSRGVRWNDPAFGIDWPFVEGLIVSDRDKNFPSIK